MKRTIIPAVCLLLVVACRTTHSSYKPIDVYDTVAADEAQNPRMAAAIFEMKFDDAAKSLSIDNFTGVKSGDLLFSRRIDSRTYLMYDPVTSHGSAPLFAGSDDDLLRISSRVLSHAGIPQTEIARSRILQEELRVASFDRTTRAISNLKASKGKRYALVTRQIDGIPVFSSRLLLTVSAKGQPSFAELHWPELPARTVAEAKRLQSLVREGWNPPQRSGSRPESIEAGIIHSPATATVMDIVAVIRVIYSSADSKGGIREQLFFDRGGRAVEPPRMFARMTQTTEAKDRSRGKE